MGKLFGKVQLPYKWCLKICVHEDGWMGLPVIILLQLPCLPHLLHALCFHSISQQTNERRDCFQCMDEEREAQRS